MRQTPGAGRRGGQRIAPGHSPHAAATQGCTPASRKAMNYRSEPQLTRQAGGQASMVGAFPLPASHVRAASPPLASASATPSPVSEAITAA